MKKLLFVLTVGLLLASCGNNSGSVTSSDSTELAEDTTLLESLKRDTQNVVIDTLK
jgi:uncharacterized protein YcfL